MANSFSMLFLSLISKLELFSIDLILTYNFGLYFSFSPGKIGKFLTKYDKIII